MKPDTSISPYRDRLEMALIQYFGARGDTLGAKLQSVAEQLPEGLSSLLEGLVVPPPDASSEAADYAFRCGLAVERVENLAKIRAAEDLIFTDTAGNAVTDPERTDLDALSRFRAARDRMLRKAADFSLKVLLIGLGLLVLSFSLGLI